MFDRPYSLSQYTAPTAEPVTVADLMRHLRLTESDESEYLASLLQAARETAEARLGMQLVSATWDWTFDSFPSSNAAFRVPRPPLQSVTSIAYYNTAGTLTTLAAASYRVNAGLVPGLIEPAYGYYWPEVRDMTGAVTVRFVAGYGGTSPTVAQSVAAVPARIKHLVKLLAAHWYENREPIITGTIVAEMPQSLELLFNLSDYGRYCE
jgi:uncharacterized phiE125 gp8 family phage protein